MGFSAKKCKEDDEICNNSEKECMYHQIQRILKSPDFPTKENRQTLVFSATFALEIQKLVNKVLLKKVNCMVTNKKFELPNLRIQHSFMEIPKKSKLDQLLEILKKDVPQEANNLESVKRTLVFVNFRGYVYTLARFLQKNGINADGIEGYNFQRQKTLNKFCKNKIQVLVSSDLCGRGIDVKGLDQVINYDIPKDKTTYVHRVGRVGRVHEGHALSFFDSSKDGEKATYLVAVLQQAGTEIPECLIKAIEAKRFGN